MKTEFIDIRTPAGVCDAFIAYPDNGTYPAVILFMDAFGLRPGLYDMARKLASHGYYVLLPNLFYRIRKAPVLDVAFPLRADAMPDAIQAIRALLADYKPDLAMQDADAFLAFLSTQPRVRQGQIGTTGYCMGGALSLRVAARHPEAVGAVASFHAGNLATDGAESPHLLLDRIQGEIYVAHADNDTSMPPEQIERFDAALKSVAVAHASELYAGAAHGFTMADLPAYDGAALARHWENLLALLGRNLQAEN